MLFKFRKKILAEGIVESVATDQWRRLEVLEGLACIHFQILHGWRESCYARLSAPCQSPFSMLPWQFLRPRGRYTMDAQLLRRVFQEIVCFKILFRQSGYEIIDLQPAKHSGAGHVRPPSIMIMWLRERCSWSGKRESTPVNKERVRREFRSSR